MERPAFSDSTFHEYPLEQLVSPDNIRRWTGVYGAEAQAWLDVLPSIVHDYAERWELTIEEPLEGGTVSAVIGALRHDEPTVLKIHPPWLAPMVPDKTSAETEAAAYEIWDGDVAPRLLASDKYGLLLERIMDARHSPDMDANDMAAMVARISRVMPEAVYYLAGIPPIQVEIHKRYLRAAEKGHPEISEATLLNARNMIALLCMMPLPDRVNFPASRGLVHGDLKVKNILERPDGSKFVIDPSPAVGNRLYDATLWTIDKPEGILDRCSEVADCLEINSKIVGNLAIALTMSEICLASPARAAATLEYVKEFTGRSSLAGYFDRRYMFDAGDAYFEKYKYRPR